MAQITIAGDVHLIGWDGKRVSFWEKYDFNGKEYSRLWTAWFDAANPEVQEQDWVEISGELSTKIGRYTPKGATEEKVIVEHHIQNASVKQHRSKAEQQASLEEIPF
jgi:hypothetical protein